MTAPLSAIITATRQQSTPTELQQAAASCLQDIVQVYYSVGFASNNIAGRYALHGGDAIIAQIAADHDAQALAANPEKDPPSVAFRKAMGLLAQVWPSFSDEPFPALPAEPVPVDAPAEPEVTA